MHTQMADDVVTRPEAAPGPAATSLADVVRGHLDGVASIVELAGPDVGLNLRAGLDPGEAGGLDYRRVATGTLGGPPGASGDGAAGPWLGPDTLAVIPVGPDPARHLPVKPFGAAARPGPVGARGLLLLGFAPARLPYQHILDVLAARNCLILQAEALDETDFPSAVVFARADPGPPGPDAGPPAQDAGLRNMNEYVLGRFVGQALNARLAALSQADAGDAPGPGAVAGQPPEAARPFQAGPFQADPFQADPFQAGPVQAGTAQAGLALERDRLARALRGTQRELVGMQEKLTALERSTSLEVGRAVVGVAKRPWREGTRLPLGLYRLWRERSGAALARRDAGGRPGSALTVLQDSGGAGLGDRWLAAYTAPGTAAGGVSRLVITGALTALSAATMEPDAIVVPLLPHDADFVLEGTGADLVLIEAAAMLPGCAWAYAGDPAATDRGRRLAAMVSLARSLGKPVVLLRNAPWQLTAGLDWLAASCDAVIDGDLGVQLARFNPIGLDAGRPCHPVYAALRDPREPPAVRLVLDELTRSHGLVAASDAVSWRSAPARYREHGLFVAANDTQAREQLAAGARVIGPVATTGTASGGAPGADAAQAAREIAAGRAAGAPSLAEIRLVLRDLFENHATPARLAGLARLLGLPVDVTASRGMAVLAELPDASHVQRLSHDLMRQRLRPAEVIVSLAGPRPDAPAAAAVHTVTRALRALADSGPVVRVLAGTGLRASAAAARSPWVARWEPGRDYPDCYLLDLACALECSRADAVGHAPGADYVFTQAIEPALARRDLLLPDAPAAETWGGHGLRMLSICS
jgi:hypothetical protein